MSDIDYEIVKAKREIESLKNKMRSRNRAFEVYCIGIQGTLHSQKKLLAALQKEKKTLANIMKKMQSRTAMTSDHKLFIELSIIANKLGKNLIEVRDLKVELKQIEAQLARTQGDVKKQRQEFRVVNKLLDRDAKTLKKKELLEDRIYRANMLYGQILATNDKCRYDTAGALKIRAKMNVVYHRTKKLMAKREKYFFDVVEIAYTAYHERENLMSRMHLLKRRIKHDKLRLQNLIKDMAIAIRVFDEQEGFISAKGKIRITEEYLKKEEAKRADLSQHIKKELLFSEGVMKQITKTAGETRIKEMINIFLQEGDINLTLFRYISELAREEEKLKLEIKDCKSRMLQIENKEKSIEKESSDIEAEADARVVKVVKETETVEEQKNKLQEQLDEAMKAIYKLLDIVNYKLGSQYGLLAEADDVEEHNTLLYVGHLEARITDLLDLFIFKRLKELEEKLKDQPPSVQLPKEPPPHITSLIAKPPELGESKIKKRQSISVLPYSEDKLRILASAALKGKDLPQ